MKIYMVLVTALLCSMPSVVQAQIIIGSDHLNSDKTNVSRNLTITIDNYLPTIDRISLATTANDVLSETFTHFSSALPAGNQPIVCVYDKDIPKTYFTGNLSPYYIQTTVKSTLYCQFVFQLSHELGHIMLDPRRDNGLIETCATALSYQILSDMGKRWTEHPSLNESKEYAHNFSEYLETEQQDELKNFPEIIKKDINDKNWREIYLYLRLRRVDQDNDYTNRELNCLGALMLIAQGINWDSLRDIAKSTVPSPLTNSVFNSDARINLLSIEPNLRKKLQMLGRGCSTAMMIAYFEEQPIINPTQSDLVFHGDKGWIWLHECSISECASQDAVVQAVKPKKLYWDISDTVKEVKLKD